MNIETLQAAERVSAWYRNRRLVASVSSHVVTDAANDPREDESAEEHPQGCSSEVSSTGVAALLRSAHITPATSKATPTKVSA